jgi:hypothetical protein
MVQVHLSRRILAGLGILLVGPWLIVAAWVTASAVRPVAHRAPSPAAAAEQPASDPPIEGKPGPWGHLAYMHMTIELPDEFVFLQSGAQAPIRWFFKGYDKQGVTDLLKASELTPEQLDTLQNKSELTSSAEGTWLSPGDALILGLSPVSRGKIYSVLVEFSENTPCIDPVCFRPETLEARLEQSGLAAPSVALLRTLLYRNHAPLLLFADIQVALRQLPDDAERRRFIKTVSGKPSLLAALKLDATSDVDALLNYWSLGGRHKDLEPLLRALKDVEGRINIICLLPRFVREHLYNHPFTSIDPAAAKQDCFWTAFNMFSQQPDDRFTNLDYVYQTLNAEYYSISEPGQLGDLIFLATKNNTAVHAACYIADDVVFTKNGVSYSQPWLLMHLGDMIDTYSVRYPSSGPLKPLYYRRKTL